jgi:outer membrane protein TolC
MNDHPRRPVLLLLMAVTLFLSPRASAQVPGQASQPMPTPPVAVRSQPLAVPPGTFLGGVPTGQLTDAVEKISVVNAISRALEHNLGVLTAEQNLGRAEGARTRLLSELLPNINGRVGETRQTINLAAFGFSGGPGSPFGDIPSIVGPFNVFDARIVLSQTVLDFGALNGTRAEAHNVAAARLTFKSARDYVIHVAGNLFVQVLAASARADAARAQQETAQTLYQQALDLKQNGLIAGIDVVRAEVQLSTQTQRATIAVNDFEKTKLQLARVIGLPLGQRFELDPALPGLPTPDISIDDAVALGYKTRPDYQAALERVSAAEATRRSIIGDALPSVRVNADYGAIGLSPADARSTFAVTGAVNVPIFQGGRTRGRLLEADADIRNRRAEAEDLKAAIYYEVRAAFLDLDATARQLALAVKSRDLANEQLTQARDRFAAGVANNVEVVQAQDAVAIATEQFISAQYGYDLAKGALIRGTGTSEEMLRQILGGSR